MLTPIRSCQFPQGDIYWPHGMWSQRWALDGPDGDSQGFHGVNPTSVTTARPSGILFKISPFENSHDLLWYMNDASCLSLRRYLKPGIQQGEVQKKIPISLDTTTSSRTNVQHCSAELKQYSISLTACQYTHILPAVIKRLTVSSKGGSFFTKSLI